MDLINLLLLINNKTIPMSKSNDKPSGYHESSSRNIDSIGDLALKIIFLVPIFLIVAATHDSIFESLNNNFINN